MPRLKGQWSDSPAARKKQMEKNSVYLKSLTVMLKGLGKEVLATGAAVMLDTAVRQSPESGDTVVDSGRAIANWDLMIGGTTKRKGAKDELSPPKSVSRSGKSEYASTDAEAAAAGLGQKGSQGDPAIVRVPKQKAAAYGYTIENGIATVAPGSWIYEKVGVGRTVLDTKGAQTVAVHLFNPVLGPASGNGRYRRNAFPGEGVVGLARASVAHSAQASVAARIAAFNAAQKNT